MEKDQAGVGWGRLAASRFAKSPKDIQNEILKALEGKLHVDFPIPSPDYSQWQRMSLPPPPSTQPSPTKSASHKSIRSKNRPLTGTSGTTACSSLCLHPWNKKEPVVDLSAEIEKTQRISILHARIEARKKSLEQYTKLKQDLKSNNEALKQEIISREDTTHVGVRKLLEKYERYTSASKVLERNHSNQVEAARKDLQTKAEMFANNISELANEAEYLDGKVQSYLYDLQVLRTYKDKEYPVKAMCIAKLTNNVGNLSTEHRMQLEELKRIINGERGKMEGHHVTKTQEIVGSAARNAFDSCTSRSLQQLSRKNQVLMYEIVQNKQDIEELKIVVQQLQYEVDALANMRETNVRKFVFPELNIMDKATCQPDEEIYLDIPKLQLLPI
uniref:uncharacterized protein LOC100184750 n=1 Tax=Ciona intestinalis TaxID=7719 RepID=UPI000180CB44|nr:uncharacterized protein LOC100184750 [Ciona intestinalis]|eukprot:XP_002121242.3 uncharacterized protein LOC100184750 [Ciona intestinalis]